jgi:hypothetical protein
MNTETTYPFACSVCGMETGIEARGHYAAMDKLVTNTDWRILPRGSNLAKVYCPKHARSAVETRERQNG